MEIRCSTTAHLDANVDLLAITLTGNGDLPEAATDLDANLGGSLTRALERSYLSATKASSHRVSGGESGPREVLLVSLGTRPADEAERLRVAGATAASTARSLKASSVAVLAPADDSGTAAAALVEGFVLGLYRYHPYRSSTGEEAVPPAEEASSDTPPALTILGDPERLDHGIQAAATVADATNWARDLANTPGNDMTPELLAAEARELAAAHEHLSLRVIDRAGLEELGAGLLLAVGQGSAHEPRMLVLEWNPPGATEADDERLALVGKAVTFDTGGISIKPSAGMAAMRLDKAGGCAVLGGMRAIAELGIERRVLAIVPAAENMPGARAFKPGDVFTGLSGTTVEITNTDAEGRLILADAIAYARELGCARIVELSTLTGATAFFFGPEYAACIAHEGDLQDAVLSAARQTGDQAWPLPMDEAYRPAIKSDIADLVNSGPRIAGALYAGLFLQQFAKDTPFVHLDIAGSGMLDKPRRYHRDPGASGWGVRLLARLAASQD